MAGHVKRRGIRHLCQLLLADAVTGSFPTAAGYWFLASFPVPLSMAAACGGSAGAKPVISVFIPLGSRLKVPGGELAEGGNRA